MAVIDVEKLLSLLKRHPGRRPTRRPAELAGRLGGVRGRPHPREAQPAGHRGRPRRPDGVGREHAGRLAERHRRGARRGRRPGRPGRPEEGDPPPLGRAALPQRDYHLPAAVRLRHVSPRRPRRRPHLRHRGRRHRGEPSGQSHAARHLRHRPLQVGGHEPHPGSTVRGPAGRLLHAARAVHAGPAAGAQRLHGDHPAAAEPVPRRSARPSPRRSAAAGSSSSGRARTTGARSRTTTAASPAISRRTSPTGSSATSERSTRSTAQGKFDVPHLNNIYDSAPYLHNGMAPTLEEIWTRFNPYDKHGVTERHDQGPAQRPHRVPEDALTGERKR